MKDKAFRFGCRKCIYTRLGIRIGYWPCIKSPFIQFAIGKYIFDFWYGLPSYRKDT